ncbi:MAG: RNA-binding S4 domain-containing protein [Gallionella sp.]|nr:RNA-binding S4 domain-containing protein [Gallionella sp.]
MKISSDRLPGNDKLRIDKWLWAARFYKTRSLAADAVDARKVMVNAGWVKPARTIGAGDILEIRAGQVRFEVEVLAISDKRGPAPAAQKLYRESDESIGRREAIAAQLKLQPEFFTRGRPTKRDRREIEKFRHEE